MEPLTRAAAGARVEKLKAMIERQRYLYHALDAREISDAAYDSLQHELLELETAYPELVTPDSPTQRVGAKPLDKFRKVKHVVPQWSFNDAFSPGEVRAFDDRVRKFLGVGPRAEVVYTCELKIDGLHVVLTYQRGALTQGATRGDGVVGEDVTHNIRTIESVPLKLREPLDVVVEGEVYMARSTLGRLNRERQERGEELLMNPRNAAAGGLRQLDPKVAAERRLDTFIYDLAQAPTLPATQSAELARLRDLGFKVSRHFRRCATVGEAIRYWQEWQQKKDKEDYWIDGVVLKLDRRDWQERLGYTGKAPRWAIAFKFPAEQATTVVQSVEVQVGRTGVLTPVANLRPVVLMGTTVSRATLHNEDEIERLGLKVGDTVVIEKAGDVIPDIVQVLPKLRTGREHPFTMPKRCPACGSSVARRIASERGGLHPALPREGATRAPLEARRQTGGRERTVAVYCTNRSCYAQNVERAIHFAARPALDIQGLGDKVVEKLMRAGLVKDPADFFVLEKGDLLGVEGLAEVSADNLLAAVAARKKPELPRLITGLGIPHVGEETSRALAERFGTLAKLAAAGEPELVAVPDVGPVVAASVAGWFRDPTHRKLLAKLAAAGVQPRPYRAAAPGPLRGQTFVVTGRLEAMSRDEARARVRELGGRTSESVSRETSYVVVGADPGSKYDRAKKLGVTTLSEAAFLKLLTRSA